MSIRSELKPYSVITNGNMGAPTVTSSPTIVQKLSLLSYSYSWSGTAPVGTVSIQVSNDYSIDATGNVSNAGTWTTISFTNAAGTVATTQAVSGTTGNTVIDKIVTGAYAIRTVYTATSGTGSLQAVICGKVH